MKVSTVMAILVEFSKMKLFLIHTDDSDIGDNTGVEEYGEEYYEYYDYQTGMYI